MSSNQGTARESSPVSLSGMISTLVPVLVVSVIYFVIFLVLRRSQRRWYAPRTYIGSLRESQRSPELPGGLFNWFGTFWKLPDVYALQHQSLDAFLYLRFLRMTMLITFVGVCLTWPVLFPVDATGGGSKEQLDILSYANINRDTSSSRYYAHVFVAWAFYGFVMFLIFRECIYYVNLRQAFLLSPLYSSRISTRTVLFTSVPTPYLDEAKLRKVFGDTVQHVWITGDTKDLDTLVEERNKTAMKLEKAEVKLIKAANKERQKAIKNGAHVDEEAGPESGSIASRWIPDKKRPSHRLGKLGLYGKKVDTINWGRSELERLIPATETAQRQYFKGESKKLPAVFIEFKTQAEAEGAAQMLVHHVGLHMQPYIGIAPGDVIWASLRIPWWQKVIRRYAVIAFISAMIIFWAIPVAVVGAISNITYLQEKVFFLHWLEKVPPVIVGVIQGLLPSVALAILMSLVPVVMRLCARLAGEPSNSRVELFTQNAYFAFQVIQVFLITTVASAATSVGAKIAANPLETPSILAENLPLASNFYISYFIVQGLTIAAGVISQVVGFAIFQLTYRFLAGTPRALYNKWANLSAISWGSTMPVYTNIAVIAITYAAIAPLMLGWATIGLGLFYLAWRYNILFVTDTNIDTRGLIYPRAMKQLFTGVYLGEVCLIGLFGASVAPGPLVLMVVFLIFTILFHMSLNSALKPLLHNLPQTLLAEEETRHYDAEAAAGVDHAAAQQAKNGRNGADHHDEKGATPDGYASGTGKKPNFIAKFLKPWAHSDYNQMRNLVPRDVINFEDHYQGEVEQNAYFPPSVTSQAPLLWIPEDPAGISKQEVRETSRVIPITDEGCTLDDKGKLQWDRETTRPPVWEEKIVY